MDARVALRAGFRAYVTLFGLSIKRKRGDKKEKNSQTPRGKNLAQDGPLPQSSINRTCGVLRGAGGANDRSASEREISGEESESSLTAKIRRTMEVRLIKKRASSLLHSLLPVE